MQPRFLLIIILSATLALQTGIVSGDRDGFAPEVKVITRPGWVSGDLAVYIHSFPRDGAELEQKTINIRVSVWNADETHPVLLLLDGEEAARIVENGYFLFEWELMGSHRLVIRDEYRIFQAAEFNIESPPPPPLTISLTEFNVKLEKQFTQVFTFGCTAAIIGVPTGVWVKKKTKIVSEWALVPFLTLAGFGVWYLPELYMLVPWTTVSAITYLFARGYATQQVILIASEGMIDFRDYTLDDEGYIIEDIGPQYWETSFVKRKKMVLLDNNYPVDFRYRGNLVRCVTVAGPEQIVETMDKILVSCSPELAHALNKKDVIERLESQVAKTNFKLVFMERALGSIISEAVLDMERIVDDLRLDNLSSVSEAQVRVEEAAERMSSALGEQLTRLEGNQGE